MASDDIPDEVWANFAFADEDLDEDGPDRDWETCFDCAGVGCDYCGDTGVIPRQHVAVGGKDPRFAEWEEEGRRAEEEASG